MKSLKYILVPALTGLLFAACNTEPKGPTQAELDTQVEAKVKAATEQLKADCDKKIMDAAQLQKDSILVAKGNKPVAPAPKTTTPKTTTPPVKTEPVKETPKPTVGNGKPKMGPSDANTTGNGKPKMGGNKDEAGKVDETKVGNGKPKMGGR